jgi:uncharacterized protein (TIGR02594 family)
LEKRMMYKAILAAVVALGVLSVPVTAEAKPTSTEQTHIVKKKKVKKKKVKHVKVKKEQNAFLREETPVTFSSSGEESAGDFWRQEYAKNNPEPVKTAKTRDGKRQEVVKSCSWFTCSTTTTVVAEAKKWEGKHAKKNKQELKSLFASTGQGPVDPVHTPWCAAFANAILRREGYDGTDSLMARSFLTWGMRTADPKEGDVVVLKRGRSQWAGHVGFFVGYEWYDGVKYVKVLGGNQNKEVSVAYFPASQVIGYRTAAVA